MLSAIAIGIVAALMPGAAQAPPSPDQLVAALKQNLAESQKRFASTSGSRRRRSA